MAEGRLTPLPEVSPEGQVTRSLGLALLTLPGRQVSCHTFLTPVLEKGVLGVRGTGCPQGQDRSCYSAQHCPVGNGEAGFKPGFQCGKASQCLHSR